MGRHDAGEERRALCLDPRAAGRQGDTLPPSRLHPLTVALSMGAILVQTATDVVLQEPPLHFETGSLRGHGAPALG